MGLMRSAQALFATLLGLARTRLELLSVEMQEVLARLVLIMVGAVAAILLGALAVGFASVALVLAVEPQYRVAVSAALAVLFLAVAVIIGWRVREGARLRPFADSLAELRRDQSALEPRE